MPISFFVDVERESQCLLFRSVFYHNQGITNCDRCCMNTTSQKPQSTVQSKCNSSRILSSHTTIYHHSIWHHWRDVHRVSGIHNQMEAGDHQHNDAEYLPRSKTSTYVLPRKVTCIHFKNSFSMTLHVPLFRFIKKCHIICQIIFVDRECMAGLKWKKITNLFLSSSFLQWSLRAKVSILLYK